MSNDLISVMSTFFSGIWTGLSNVMVPGTDWPMSGFLLAIFTAGIIGKILKAMFGVFGSHFDSGRSGGRPTKDGRRREWGDLDD